MCINALLVSLLYRAQPDEVRLLLIDPKRVELSVYEGIPHLAAPVVTDPREAAKALRWAVKEMERRYELFAELGTRNITGYNELIPDEPLPYLVVVIDELADLMLVAAADVEDAICRPRWPGPWGSSGDRHPAAVGGRDYGADQGQRALPSLLCRLIPGRLPDDLGYGGGGAAPRQGDMLFHPVGAAKPIRAQGALITEHEVNQVVHFWRSQVDGEPEYLAEAFPDSREEHALEVDGDDELFEDAVQLVLESGQASISMIQRRFRVGYSRAARIIDLMERRGIVGPAQGSKPREVNVGRALEFCEPNAARTLAGRERV